MTDAPLCTGIGLLYAEHASLSGNVDFPSIDLMRLILRWEDEPDDQSALL